MGKVSIPKRGSKGFRRNRASSEIPRIRSWPDKEGILGFAGYKAGITHGIIIETNKKHPMVGKKRRVSLSIVEVPPIVVVGLRAYQKTPYGLKVAGEVWNEKLPKEIGRRIPLPKKMNPAEKMKKIEKEIENLESIRLITCTQPDKCTGVPKKSPEIMEQAIGGAVAEQLAKAKELLGKELKISDVFKEGDTIDVFAITKGHGFQGVIKRHGAKLQKRKYETQRKIGTLGPETPDKVLPTVPAAGQMGYHQRFSLNHRILKIDKEVTPKGGWPHYGVVKNECILIRGSIPGPVKRLIRIRRAIRKDIKWDLPEIVNINLNSKS